MLIAGVDEAGRGPIIGPLVMATIVISEDEIDKLKLLGVKDSKLIQKEKREELYQDILDIAADYKVEIISNEKIDEALNDPKNNLNKLEMTTTAKMVNESIDLEKIYVDCPTRNMNRYKTDLAKIIKNKKMRFVVENKADVIYPVVSAASIIAKVIRDKEIDKLKELYKIDFGSGYLGDKKTYLFLQNNFSRYPFFRKTWKPWKTLAERDKIKTLDRF